MCPIPTRALEEQSFNVAGGMATSDAMCRSSIAYNVFVDRYRRWSRGVVDMEMRWLRAR